MLLATQQKILQAVSRMRSDVARALGRDSLTHAEVVQGFRESFGAHAIPFPFLFESVAAQVLQPHLPDLSGNVTEAFALVDTEEKLEYLLLNLPEPSPEELDEFLLFVNSRLPQLRTILLARVKAIPHDRGGAPRKLSSREDQQKIIEEIKKLRGPRVKLGDIFQRLAQRHGVSPSKIKQIWLKSQK